jgi:hypothetical protein
MHDRRSVAVQLRQAVGDLIRDPQLIAVTERCTACTTAH